MSDVTISPPVAAAMGTEVPVMFSDYFTVEDYRAETGDRTVPYKADDDDIFRGQQEVIDRLERWAYTSWSRRSTSQQRWMEYPLFTLKRLPIIADSLVVTLDGQALTDYTLNSETGEVRWGDWSGLRAPWLRQKVLVVATFDFGYQLVPEAVRSACIQATESKIRGEEGKSKIPRNATAYSTERTDFTLGRRGVNKPWPWDPRASDDMRGYWDPKRPRGKMAAV